MTNDKIREVEDAVDGLGNLSMAIGTLDKIPEHLKKDAINNLIPKVKKLLQAVKPKEEVGCEEIINLLNETQSEGINEIQYGTILDKHELAKSFSTKWSITRKE